MPEEAVMMWEAVGDVSDESGREGVEGGAPVSDPFEFEEERRVREERSVGRERVRRILIVFVWV